MLKNTKDISVQTGNFSLVVSLVSKKKATETAKKIYANEH